MTTLWRVIGEGYQRVKNVFWVLTPRRSQEACSLDRDRQDRRYLESCVRLTEPHSFRKPAVKGGPWRERRKDF